jgi:hypothetical protein
MTTTTATSPPRNTCRLFFEESYVDAMEGRRSLADVLAQIDGLGPSLRRRNIETSRRPGRRSEVSVVMSAESTSLPVRQRAHTPCAESVLFEEGVMHGKMTSTTTENFLRRTKRVRKMDGVPLGSSSTVNAISYLDRAIVVAEEVL